MKKIVFEEMQEYFKSFDWAYFGEKKTECNGLSEEEINFYLKNNRLPSPCDKCYKTLVYWKNRHSEDNLINFFDMVFSFDFDYIGKFNATLAIFYFDNKKEMLGFNDFLNKKMDEFNVKGKIDWERACRDYRRIKPELWKNKKIFIHELE